jgi:hypothetical protein
MKPIDDAEARKLLGPLAGEPGGVQRLDVAEVVRAGDRRRRNRTLRSASWAAVALMAIAGGTVVSVRDAQDVDGLPVAGYASPSSSAAVPTPVTSPAPVGADCTVADLRGPDSAVLATDHTGRFTVTEKRSGSSRKAVVWRSGTRIAEVTLPPFDQSWYAVNAQGELAVTLSDATDKKTPYAYVDEKLIQLKGGPGAANAIADDGRVAGSLDSGHAVVWADAGAQPFELPLPEGASVAGAVGIDQDGTVAGRAEIGVNRSEGVLWLPDGSIRVLSGTGGQYYSSAVTGINNGWVIGADGYNGADRIVGFRYHIATARYEKLPTQFGNPQVVGGDGSVIGLGDDARTYLFTDGTARWLPSRLKDDAGGSAISGAIGISDDGSTVTGSMTVLSEEGGGAEGRGIVWTCR